LELQRQADFSKLSTGLKRRTLLGRALVSSPDVLLLDEPTNHLDIDAITWLEGFLATIPATLIFVTHDRAFLTKLAKRILEIDRGKLFDWVCDYPTFLDRKEQALLAQEKQDALFEKRLAEEEAWIRTGIKARRTRNEGRVRRLEEMRRVRSQRPSKVGSMKLSIDSGERSGMLVCDLKQASFGYDDQVIVPPMDLTIMRGDKIGILGRNGVGKSTLLKGLLGQLAPISGSVRLGTKLEMAYFDQDRRRECWSWTHDDHHRGEIQARHRVLAGFSVHTRTGSFQDSVLFGRAAESFVARETICAVGEYVGDGRTDERPRRRVSGVARRAIGGIRRYIARGQPRSRVSQ
jgi:ATP-binding cassette subfamily F protein uup